MVSNKWQEEKRMKVAMMCVSLLGRSETITQSSQPWAQADSTRSGIGVVSTSCPIDLHHVPWSVLLSPTNFQPSSPSVLLSPLVYILLRPSLLDLELSQSFGNDRVPAI